MPRLIAARWSSPRNFGQKPPKRSIGSGGGIKCSTPAARWFPGAALNTCWNAVDRHIAAGRGDHIALIWDSPVTGQIKRFTYRELQSKVARLAGVLTGLGVVKGDRVLIYMPMVPEAAFAMLACARIGAVHSVVFGGFAAHELATRINDARPWVVLSASCGIEVSRSFHTSR